MFIGLMTYNHHFTDGLVYWWTEVGKAFLNNHALIQPGDHESLNKNNNNEKFV